MIPAERLAEMIDHPAIDVRAQALALLSCWGELSPLVATAIQYGEVPRFQRAARSRMAADHSIRKVRFLLDEQVSALYVHPPLRDLSKQCQRLYLLMTTNPRRRVRMDILGHSEAIARDERTPAPLRDLCLYIAALATVKRDRAPITAARWLLQNIGQQAGKQAGAAPQASAGGGL